MLEAGAVVGTAEGQVVVGVVCVDRTDSVVVGMCVCCVVVVDSVEVVGSTLVGAVEAVVGPEPDSGFVSATAG